MPKNPPIAKHSKTPRAKTHNKYDIIYSNQWKKVSKAYRESFPICQRCEYLGQITKRSTMHLSVHHIRGRIKRPDLAFDYDNLLTLCAGCHNGYFTKLEDAGKESQAIEEGEEIKKSFK